MFSKCIIDNLTPTPFYSHHTQSGADAPVAGSQAAEHVQRIAARLQECKAQIVQRRVRAEERAGLILMNIIESRLLTHLCCFLYYYSIYGRQA